MNFIPFMATFSSEYFFKKEKRERQVFSVTPLRFNQFIMFLFSSVLIQNCRIFPTHFIIIILNVIIEYFENSIANEQPRKDVRLRGSSLIELCAIVPGAEKNLESM